ncbi:hypothetical protein F2Q69_00023348 [Brassica cretica]|uniref:Uncharacterized protein n=1 Tax=Brassica cretica TaxID=69181 RepID=A0A8S9Q9K7_BRACR|nr:hypothetical protein F2Q69_00023348 [Brassica cretica]
MISSFTSPPSDLRVTVTLPRRNPLSSRSRSTTADVTRLSKSPDQTALRFRVAAAVHREDEAVLAAVEEVEDEDEVKRWWWRMLGSLNKDLFNCWTKPSLLFVRVSFGVC